VDQGIRQSVVRYVSRHKAAGDGDALARTVNSAVALYSGAGVLSLVITAVGAMNFGHWFRIDPALLPSARVAVALAGLSLALGFPLGGFGATLSGLQRYDLANMIGIGIAVLRAIVFIIVLRTGG